MSHTLITEALAQTIIARFFVDPDEDIQQAHRVDDTMIIVDTSIESWQLQTVDGWANFRKGDDYALYEVRRYIFSSPPPRAHGIAAVNDHLFYLNHQTGFQDFYAHLARRISPLEVAALLARYQTVHGASERLVMDRHDLIGLLSAAQIAALPAEIEFRAKDQPVEITFFTFYLAQDASTNLWKATVNRWHVVELSDRRLTWSVNPVAEDLTVYPTK